MEKNIKNLIFDLGGVIIDIRRQNCIDALRKLGMPDADQFLGDSIQKGPFLSLEDGSITAAQFRDELRARISRPVTDDDIDHAFGKFLVEIPVDRLRMLESLHHRYRLYILSNTNPIMWNSGIRQLFEADGHNREYYFDGEVASFKARCVKPHKEIFQYAIDHLGINPAESLFFDDSIDNVNASREIGFNAVHVPHGTDITTIVPPWR